MKLTHERRGKAAVLSLRGELAGGGADRVRQAAEQRMREDEARDFVVDCAGVSRVDSQGLEALLWLQETCEQRLGQVRLAGCGGVLRTALMVTRLEQQLKSAEDVDAAVRSLG